uniref:Uncharacterized protein n=1 Tax=Romanomermis culicivorax TaxID=13658 RepID=A0A915JC75_ROMCU
MFHTLRRLTCDRALNTIRDVGSYDEAKQILMCMNALNCDQDMLQCELQSIAPFKTEDPSAFLNPISTY